MGSEQLSNVLRRPVVRPAQRRLLETSHAGFRCEAGSARRCV